MAELSDFGVAISAQFLRASILSTRFCDGVRDPDRTAVLQVSALGGYRTDASGMNISVRLNDSSLSQHSVPRWQDHSNVIPHVVIANFVSERIRASGSNKLVFDHVYADESNYCWVGPTMVQFRQNS